MIGNPRGVFFHQPRSHDASAYRDREQEALRQHRDRFLANLFQQRNTSNPGRHSPFGHMGSRASPMSFVPDMAAMMGGHRRHGLSNPVDDFALRLGMMGGGPQMSMGHGVGMGMGLGMGYGQSRPSLRHHAPYIRRHHAPMGYNSPGPPRAHSFMPTHRSAHRHMHSPYHHSLQSPFSPSSTTLLGDDDSDDEDFESDYLFPPRRSPGRHSRRSHMHSYRYPSRRRRHRSSVYEDSEDEFDDYDDFEDDFDDEDGLDSYFSRPRRVARWM